MPLLSPAFRLYLLCVAALLSGLGLARPAVAAPATAAAVTASQLVSHDNRHGAQELLQPEALGVEAVSPRGQGLTLFPPFAPPLAVLPSTPAWRTAAGLAAHAVPVTRVGALTDYFRTRLLQAALSPHAP